MQNEYLTILVLGLFSVFTYCNTLDGAILFPGDVPKPSNFFEPQKNQPPYHFSAPSHSLSENPSQSDNSDNIPPPTSVAAKARRAYSSTASRYPPKTLNYHPYSIPSQRESVPLSEPDNYREDESSENNINGGQKIFAQMEEPPCAKGSSLYGLCEDDPDYDHEVEERFELALRKMNLSESLHQSIISKLLVDAPISITSRFGGNDILEDPVCPAKEKIIFPKRGMNENKEWVFLLNQGNVEQAIKVEECLNTSGFGRLSRLRSNRNGELTCGLMTDTGEESVCKQKFIFKNVIAMDRTGSNVVTEAILVPSCCVCLRKLSASRAANRFGLEFDEEGNLITEPPNQSQNNNVQQNQNSAITPSDDEDFSFTPPEK